MKRIFCLLVLPVILIVFSGCGTKAAAVTFNDLISNPQQFNGKTVTIEGIYVSGWESTVLTQDINFTIKDEIKELNIIGKPIWFAGSLALDIQTRLYQNNSPAAGPQHFGKLRVTGLFEYGGNYGYGKIYKYRITATKTEMLDWAPPK